MNMNTRSFSKYGIQSMTSAVMDAHRFSQMLCKIAHAYAVAQVGADQFVPMLPDYILGDGGYPYHFVGGRDGELTASAALHEIGYEEQEAHGKRYLVVRVRLFASLGALIISS